MTGEKTEFYWRANQKVDQGCVKKKYGVLAMPCPLNTTLKNLQFQPTPDRKSDQIRSDQSLSRVQLFATPWIAARQASLSINNSQSPPKPMSIESVMPSNHLILCHPLVLPPSIFPNIRGFSNESVLCIRWPKYWSFSFNISPSNEYSIPVYSFSLLLLITTDTVV